MKKKKSIIPEFKTKKEEAKFWDMHSFADYWDELEDVEIVVDLKKPKEEALVVRLQKDLKEKIAAIAHRRGLNVSTLARMWLVEKLRNVR